MIKANTLLLALGLVMTACGTDETTRPIQYFTADISEENPEANLGVEGCSMTVAKADIDSVGKVDAEMVVDDLVLPISHFNPMSRVYLLEDTTSIKTVELFRDFARATVICK